MRQALSFGLRLMRTRPLFASAIVATLGIAIAATAAVYGVLDRLLVRPLPFAEAHRIVLVSNAWPLFLDGIDGEPAAGSDALARLAQYQIGRVSIGTDEPRVARIAGVTREFFAVLGVAPAAGVPIGGAAREQANVIVLGSSLARRVFGDERSALGMTLRVNGRVFVVQAVMPREFSFLVRGEPVEAFVPFIDDDPVFLGAQTEGSGAIARLEAGQALEEAQASMDVVLRRIAQRRPELRLEDERIRLVPLRDHWYGPLKAPLLMLFGAAGCLLLIAVANTTGLLLSRAAARQNETAIRAMLGASRARLAREAMGESVLLGLLAAALGVLLARWGADVLLALSPTRIPQVDEMFTFRVVAFALLIALPSASLSSLFAAWKASRGDLSRGLAVGMRQGTFMASRTRRILVVAQVAVTVLLLVNSGLLLRSFRALRYESTGFDARNVLTLEIAPVPTQFPNAAARLPYYQQILRSVRDLPGVETVSMVNYLPIFSGSLIVPVEVPEVAGGEPLTWSYRAATPDYFRAMRIPLLAGRTFTERDGPDAPPVAIVDRSAAARLAGTSARPDNVMGKHVTVNLGGAPVSLEIVGVVGDVRQQGLAIPAYPGFYLSAYQRTPSVMNLVVRSSSEPARVMESLRNALRAVDPLLPVGGLTLLEARVSDTVSRRRFATVLSGAALLLSLVGLFALMSQFVVHRTHEIGVRVAMGARPRDILRLVLRQGGVIVATGVAAGLAATMVTSPLVAGLLYGVGTEDPLTLASVPLLVLVVAGIACSIPAARALRANPVDALRRD